MQGLCRCIPAQKSRLCLRATLPHVSACTGQCMMDTRAGKKPPRPGPRPLWCTSDPPNSSVSTPCYVHSAKAASFHDCFWPHMLLKCISSCSPSVEAERHPPLYLPRTFRELAHPVLGTPPGSILGVQALSSRFAVFVTFLGCLKLASLKARSRLQ